MLHRTKLRDVFDVVRRKIQLLKLFKDMDLNSVDVVEALAMHNP